MARGRNLYQEALDKWGQEAQIDMAIEEMGELIVALKHFKRGRIGAHKVAEEVADVSSMMKQLEIIVGHANVYEWAQHKLRRLEARIDGKDDAMMQAVNEAVSG